MKQVITTERVPVKLWLDDIEDGAMAQSLDLAKLPFAFHHVAIMPDAHQGYGLPIGGVLPTQGAVIPNAVGVDIGCGMCAVRTSLAQYDTESLKKVMSLIRERVPVGFGHHKEKQTWNGFYAAPEVEIIQRELQSAQYQIGTLGGGNHFIEIQLADDGRVWLMLHSGSRNFGLKIANDYHTKAKELCEKWNSGIPNSDLSFLPTETAVAVEYLDAMNFALRFAEESRLRMMEEVERSLLDVFTGTAFEKPINVHHNYARMENHFGKNVLVHRKGATSARLGETGIIPGSQGTASYIVRGLGNPESFESCSHGVGRRMGRKQAQRELVLVDEIKRLDDAGIIHSIRAEKDLDEAAGAYKDIDVVMANQADLVEIVTKLRPLAVIKAQ
jgi:tRNA-splicing ligase RtcB